MSISTMGRLIPPPPRQNKNKLWDRYSKGEVLKPTYEPIDLRSNIPPPPRPQEPRSITEGKLSLIDIIVFAICFIAMLAIGIYGSFFYTNT